MCMLHTWTWVCKHVPMEARGLSFFVLLPWDRVWNWTGSALLWLGRPAGESLGSGCLMLGLQVHVAVPDFICVNVYVCVCRLSAFHSKCLWKEVKDLENGASWSLKQIEKRVCVCVCACVCVRTSALASVSLCFVCMQDYSMLSIWDPSFLFWGFIWHAPKPASRLWQLMWMILTSLTHGSDHSVLLSMVTDLG